VKYLAAILSAVLYSSPILAFADFSGPVVSVLDGDTIEVLLFLRGNTISRVKAGIGERSHHDAGIDRV